MAQHAWMPLAFTLFQRAVYMRGIAIAILVNAAFSPASAQDPIQFGTDPSAPYATYRLAVDPAIPRIHQYIMTPTNVMFYDFLTIGLWIDPSHALPQWSTLSFAIGSNATQWNELHIVQSTYVGWHYFTAAVGGRLLPATQLYFGLASSGNADYIERCHQPATPDPDCPADPGYFGTRRSTGDAYLDGYSLGDDEETGDLLFQGLWHNGETTVPEPLSFILLSTGLLGVLAASRARSRRSGQAGL